MATRSSRSRAVFQAMVVGDAMHEGVYYCSPGTVLSEVAEIMLERGIHAVVVMGDRAPVDSAGIISALDLVAAATTRSLEVQQAGASAATRAITVTLDRSLAEAAELMTKHAATHLLVVDGVTRAPLGVLSTLDVVRAIIGDHDV